MRGYEVDEDSGGFVGEIYTQSIKQALSQKVHKTRLVAGHYNDMCHPND